MDEALLFWIRIFLEIGVVCTIISVLSITLFKKTKLTKFLFAISTFLLVVVIASGILLLSPISKINTTSTKTPKAEKAVASKPIVAKKTEPKVAAQKTVVPPKVETKKESTSTKVTDASTAKKDNTNKSTDPPSSVSQSKAREIVEAKILSFGGQIKGPVKTIEEGWNHYYSFNVYEPKNNRYLSAFVNIATGEITNADYGIDTVWN